MDLLSNILKANKDDVINILACNIQSALIKSNLLNRLKYYQLYTDPIDIENVFKLNERRLLNDECEDMNLNDLMEIMNLIPTFNENEVTYPTNEELINFSNQLTPYQLSLLYTLSMTLKDCSIFINLINNDIKLIDLDYKPVSRLIKWFNDDRLLFQY